MKTYVVIAGNFLEYSSHIDEILENIGSEKVVRYGTAEYRAKTYRVIYAVDLRPVLGLRNWELVKVGNWYRGMGEDDLAEIEVRYRMEKEIAKSNHGRYD